MTSPDWTAVSPASLFQPGAPVDALVHDFGANEPLNLPIRVPLLLEQGTADTLVPAPATENVEQNLCGAGAHVRLDEIQGATHASVLTPSLAQVKR